MAEAQLFLRPREVAALLGVTRDRIYTLVRAREIPSTKVGGAIRIPRDAWERWVSAKSKQALAGTTGGGQ